MKILIVDDDENHGASKILPQNLSPYFIASHPINATKKKRRIAKVLRECIPCDNKTKAPKITPKTKPQTKRMHFSCLSGSSRMRPSQD